MPADKESDRAERRGFFAGNPVYIVALTIIGAISLCTLWLSTNILKQQARSATMLTLAFRQNTQAQAITRIAESIADGTTGHDDGVKAMLALADRMDREEQQLVNGDAQAGLAPMTSARRRTIYFEDPVRLDAQIAAFLTQARLFAASPAPTLSDPSLRAMAAAAGGPLPSGIDTALDVSRAALDRDIRRLKRALVGLTAVMLVVVVLQAFFIYRPLARSQQKVIDTLKESSMTDALTSVLNRSAFLTMLERELGRAARVKQPLCLLIADIDRFQLLNDRYGPAAGDIVLQHFTASAELSLRSGDSLGRLGGEEFGLILPSTDLAGGVLAAERIRQRFSGMTAAIVPDGRRVTSTVSIGALCALDMPLSLVMEEADALLVKAKANGRNRVEAGTAGLAHDPGDATPLQAAG